MHGVVTWQVAPMLALLGPGRLPVGRLPVGRLPVGRLPVGRLPVGRLPVGRLPVGRLPVGRLPVGRVPVGWVLVVRMTPTVCQRRRVVECLQRDHDLRNANDVLMNWMRGVPLSQ